MDCHSAQIHTVESILSTRAADKQGIACEEGKMTQYSIKLFSGIALLFAVAGCSPTVKVEAPDKPITINLNVKIEQEIRVKIDKDIDELITKDSGLF